MGCCSRTLHSNRGARLSASCAACITSASSSWLEGAVVISALPTIGPMSICSIRPSSCTYPSVLPPRQRCRYFNRLSDCAVARRPTFETILQEVKALRLEEQGLSPDSTPRVLLQQLHADMEAC